MTALKNTNFLANGKLISRRRSFARGVNSGMTSSVEVYALPNVGYRYESLKDALKDDAKAIRKDVKKAKSLADAE